ncbi:uncharacterized protein LOC103867920 isoform X1 [Brassica rapa]|uniref:uncharacterized protein LOC103867920 isoform X1 n=2 Tax=Brassica campestris TaxID=3711 RepID=UPI00142E343C|nr:uncharacterized protein LOC103867920 isoform X1 [Brassica rapa]
MYLQTTTDLRLMASLTMEEKQLDFNRPLLSVRRPAHASEPESKPRSSDPVTNKTPPPSAPPVYKSDIKSGPVRNPGTVPFQWEHQPGKPKDETKPGLQSFVEPHYVPKPPPGRGRERQVSSVWKPETRVEDAKSCDEQDLMMGRFLPAAKAKEPVKMKQNKAGDNQICLRSSFGVLNPVPSVRMQAQRAVSVRRMRSKYQDNSNEPVNEDERKLRLNGSVAQGGSLAVESSSCTSRAKVSRNFGELLASDDNAWKPSSESPVAEKTLYVDTVHSVDKEVQEESMEQSLLTEEVKNLIRPGEESVIRDEAFTECTDQAIVALPKSNVVVEVTKEKIDLEVKFKRNTRNLDSSRLHHRSTYHIVPPPPLPKAPSDSWLKRTLPTIPPKNNSFTWLQSLGADDNKIHNQASPKWETMVKTSNAQQGFVCFSKETLNPIPEA